MANFTGTAGSDTLTGGAGDDLIEGLGGADSLTGAGGNDAINGGDGNDTINGGAGNDVLNGGLSAAGSPDYVTYQTASGAVTVNLAAGTAAGAEGSDSLSGFEGVIGSNFNDTLTGDSDLNFLRGGLGNDTLDGGAGSDYAQYQGASASVTVNLSTGSSSGADGNDTLIRIENIRGSNFGDTLTGDSGDNFLRGGSGNDTVDGGAGNDIADYNNATASVTVNLSTGTSSGADGNDTLTNMEGIRGGDGDDTLTGDSGNNSLQGGSGEDEIEGLAGNDTIDGSRSGVDDDFDMATFNNSPSAVSVNLGAGTALDGFGGTDTLVGIEGLIGSAFNDTLVGGGAGIAAYYNAELFGGMAGNDTLNGGDADPASLDVAAYFDSPSAVNVNLGTGTASDGHGGTDTLVNINGALGSSFNDSLMGGSGDDWFQGGAGNDSIVGGAGSDTIDYSDANAAITINLATSVFQGGSGDTDIISGVENVNGSDSNDSITGDSGGNRLTGNRGNDTLNGGAGTDTADYFEATASVTANLSTGTSSGAEGNDTLIGIENIRGGGFNDTLTGDSGNNSLEGDAGDDVLRQTAGTDTLAGGEGSDRIEFSQTGITYAGAIGVTVNLATHVSDLDNSAAGANATLVSIETVFGTSGNDVFIGGDPEHAPDLLGNRTTEIFRPSGGNDIITGATGYFNTRVDYSTNTNAQAVSVNLGTGTASNGQGGTDTLIRVDQVFGGSGNDALFGGGLERSASGGFFEQFRGNAGNDTIDGAGTDTVLGAAGSDRVNYVNSSAAVIVNLGATPYVVGGDTVPGGAARDGYGSTDTLLNINQVQGSAFSDTLVGEADNQRLIGDAGNDTLVGTAYGVEASYEPATSAVVANLATGTASDGQGGTDTLINITDLQGSGSNDILTGNDADNRLQGNPGADTLDGGAGIDFANYASTPVANGGITAFIENGAGVVGDGMGSNDTLNNIEGIIGTHANDTLAGGAGEQWFNGRGGSDSINGGAGNDWMSYIDDEVGVTVNLGTGSATDGWGGVWALGGTDTLISIENVEGSEFADQLIGNSGANKLRGNDGDDTLSGGGGVDTAVYENAREDHTITPTASGFTVSEPGGTDTLISIERFEFFGENLAFDLGVEQATGNTVRVIGAAFDAPAIQAHPDWVGIGLQFFDGGMSMLQVCDLVAAIMGLSDAAFVTTVFTNVVGFPPDTATLNGFVGLLQGSGGPLTQGQLLEIAADNDLNALQINLVGMHANGVEFV